LPNTKNCRLTKKNSSSSVQNAVNIRAIKQTLRVLVGQNDDVSYADRFAAVFKTAGKDVSVTVLPGIDHISLTLDPVAVQAAIAAVESMDHEKPKQTMKPTAPSQSNFKELATPPCRGLSISR